MPILKLIAGFVIGVLLTIAAGFTFLLTTDIGYHKLTVENDTDTRIFVAIGNVGVGRSRGIVEAHSIRTIKGSRFETPDEVWFQELPAGKICTRPWKEAKANQPFAVESMQSLCCQPSVDVICGSALDPTPRLPP